MLLISDLYLYVVDFRLWPIMLLLISDHGLYVVVELSDCGLSVVDFTL